MMGESCVNEHYDTKMDIRRMFYKNPIKKDNIKLELDETPQEQRRQTLLEFQKKSRTEAFNAARGILEETFLLDSKDELMDTEKYTSNFKPSTQFRPGYRVMMSEWMLDVPEDFTEKWIMVPCPVGKRTVLVASKGITKAYSKKSKRIAVFPSALPGGNPHDNNNGIYTILDCIWEKTQRVYYILDVLAWRKQPITNCEAEFRLFWLKSKLMETEELQERDTKRNKYPMLSLPTINCDTDLSVSLGNLNLNSLDGLLFYHRNSHYTFGFTPLMTWLKAFMLPEVLGVFVPSPYDNKPDGYIDFQHYIRQRKKDRRKKVKSNSHTYNMEITESDA